MRVLVCGGRKYDNEPLLSLMLNKLNYSKHIDVIIHGGAMGADRLAARWAKANNKFIECYQADWGVHGRAAGPIRNKRMLEKGKPDLVVAFAGGRGTENMIKQAEQAGVKVMRIKE